MAASEFLIKIIVYKKIPYKKRLSDNYKYNASTMSVMPWWVNWCQGEGCVGVIVRCCERSLINVLLMQFVITCVVYDWSSLKGPLFLHTQIDMLAHYEICPCCAKYIIHLESTYRGVWGLSLRGGVHGCCVSINGAGIHSNVRYSKGLPTGANTGIAAVIKLSLNCNPALDVHHFTKSYPRNWLQVAGL